MKNRKQAIKNSIWKVYTVIQFSIRPFHPVLRVILFKLRIVRHGTRQPYLIGYLKNEVTVSEFKSYLLSKGFETPFAMWLDEGEVLSIRYRPVFEFQYHIRVYENKEVRCHYEITPEEAPLDHLTDRFTEPRREEFMEWLEGWIIPTTQSDDFILEKTISHNALAASRTGPENG
jgi:hypothetical protein